MKFFKKTAAALMIAVVAFTNCDPPNGAYHTVTFDSAGGSDVAEQTVKDGGTVAQPEDPTRTGYVLDSWCLGSSSDAYNFSTPVTADITLTAKWTGNGNDDGNGNGNGEDGTGNTLTLTTNYMGEAWIYLGGTGTATIDWGDGSVSQTVILSAFNFNTEEFNAIRYRNTHTFSVGTPRTIVIEGENITYLGNGTRYVTALDVSKNTALTVLHFSDSDITSLDVSKNTTLTNLNCYNNKFTAAGLKALFGTLHSNAGSKRIYITIYPTGNPGTDSCDTSIATAKGWTVL